MPLPFGWGRVVSSSLKPVRAWYPSDCRRGRGWPLCLKNLPHPARKPQRYWRGVGNGTRLVLGWQPGCALPVWRRAHSDKTTQPMTGPQFAWEGISMEEGILIGLLTFAGLGAGMDHDRFGVWSAVRPPHQARPSQQTKESPRRRPWSLIQHAWAVLVGD